MACSSFSCTESNSTTLLSKLSASQKKKQTPHRYASVSTPCQLTMNATGVKWHRRVDATSCSSCGGEPGRGESRESSRERAWASEEEGEGEGGPASAAASAAAASSAFAVDVAIFWQSEKRKKNEKKGCFSLDSFFRRHFLLFFFSFCFGIPKTPLDASFLFLFFTRGNSRRSALSLFYFPH